MNVAAVGPVAILFGGCAVAIGVGFVGVTYWLARALFTHSEVILSEPIGVAVLMFGVLVAAGWVAVGVGAYLMAIERWRQ